MLMLGTYGPAFLCTGLRSAATIVLVKSLLELQSQGTMHVL